MPLLFDQKVTLSFAAAQVATIVMMFIVISAALKFRDLEDALGFYGVYHQEPLNQLIHFFGVPGILWSILIIFAHLPLPFLGNYAVRIPFCASHPISWATVAFLFYTLFYIYIDLFGGTLFSVVVYSMYVTASNWTRADQNLQKVYQKKDKQVPWVGTGRILKLATGIHILSWYIQIHPGHIIREGAKPAVLDSVGGALTSAPLFAFYEGLWFWGIKKDLQAKTHALVAQHTARLCAEGANMRVCETLN